MTETPAPLRAVALIRMSSAKQLSSPARQRELFIAYCGRYGLTPVNEYEDLAVSATHTKLEDRPGIMQMWADAMKDLFDVVWAEESSRASRDMIETLQIHKYLEALGIPLVEGDEDPRHRIDPMHRKLITAIRGWQAEAETKQLAARMKRNQQVLLTRGDWVGGHLPAGIRWDAKERKWALDEPAAALPRRAYELFAETRQFAETARRLYAEGFTGPRGGAMQTQFVADTLRHGWYRGRIERDGETYQVALPEVIPPATLAEVDSILGLMEGRPQRAINAKALFAGVLRCPVCGRWMSPTYKGQVPHYRCQTRVRAVERCSMSRSISERKLERLLLPTLAAQLREMADHLKAEAPPKRRGGGKRQVRQLELARQRARRLYIDGVVTRQELDEELARLDRAGLERAEAPPAPTFTSEELRTHARTLEERWSRWARESKRELLLALVQEIVFNPDDPAKSEVRWRLG